MKGGKSLFNTVYNARGQLPPASRGYGGHAMNYRLISRSVFYAGLAGLISCTTLPPTSGTVVNTYKLPAAARTLDMFKPGNDFCYDRDTLGETFVVDTHNHFRPFGGAAKSMEEINQYLLDTGVLFVNVFGIGQSLPVDSDCEYYLDCIGTPATPSIKNDMVNAMNYLDVDPEGTVMTLSMTFPDLANPGDVVDQIALFDKEYPGMFTWMGEVNLVKQALFGNHHAATPKASIAGWADFMAILRERDIPISIHADLGSDAKPLKYAHLMDEVLRLYPDNKIVWVHMGLSKELSSMDAGSHIAKMQTYLDEYPKLMLDITWRVIYDNYFMEPHMRAMYVDFFEKNADRILPGTDFVASHKKSYGVYRDEVLANSDIFKDLNNDAFRKIALGQNYFDITGIDFVAPQVCE